MKGIGFILLCLGLIGGTPASGKEPIGGVPARDDGPATTLTATGTIARVSRQQSEIGFFSDKPFWGPARYGASSIALWPADTFFVLYISGPTPITIDGKKASFGQLVVGQRVFAQYNVTQINWGMNCVARRVEAHAAAPAKSAEAKNKSPNKH